MQKERQCVKIILHSKGEHGRQAATQICVATCVPHLHSKTNNGMDDVTFIQVVEFMDDDDGHTEALIMHHMQLLAELEETETKQKGSAPGKRPNIERDFAAGHLRIMQDYFWPAEQQRNDGSMLRGPVYSSEHFRRRFAMSREIFDRVFSTVVLNQSYFRLGLKPNCVGKIGLSPLQKVVSAVRQICYGTSADAMDDYIRISESSAMLSLKHFCDTIVNKFERQYLRLPTAADLKRIENQFSSIGFPGCVGCLDCSGWQWESCPRGLQGLLCGKEGKPVVKMEVICDLNLYMWHFYFGLPGMLNDLDIMWLSPLMNAIKVGKFPSHDVKYNLGTESFDWLYFLTDGIYPDSFKIFIQSLPHATEDAKKLFSKLQEGARKCVERVFAVLFKRFGILNIPARIWCDKDMVKIIKACVIIHNMCMEERRDSFIGNGVGGLRDERIEREATGNYTSLEMTERMELQESSQSRPSSVYDDIDEKMRLTEALVDNIKRMYG